LQSAICNSYSAISPRLTARLTASVRFAAPSFPEIAAYMEFDRLIADAETLGDRLVRQPFGE
jgi:hypothetical protein